jgi:hypothetical protein
MQKQPPVFKEEMKTSRSPTSNDLRAFSFKGWCCESHNQIGRGSFNWAM